MQGVRQNGTALVLAYEASSASGFAPGWKGALSASI